MLTTKFFIGIVNDVQDTNKSYSLRVILENNEEVTVIYTSPFFFVGGGGILTPPNVGSKVLLLKDEEQNEYYYISTIVGGRNPNYVYDPSIKILPLVDDPTIYTEKNIPQKILVTNEVGSGLKVSRKKLKRYIDSKVELKSEFGKKVALIDSPMNSQVLMRNEHGDGIRIISHDWLAGTKGYPHPIYPSRSIITYSKGPQFYTTVRGSMNLLVSDGLELNIQNHSTGAYGPPSTVINNPSLSGAADPSERVGNINIKSVNSDVNISVKGTQSEIYITTPKARIEIRDDGTVLIHSTATINLKSDGDINLKSASNINMEAGGEFNMKSSTDFNIESTGGKASIKSSENCNIDGKEIHLNSGFSSNATSPTEIDIQRNAYGE